MGIVKIAVSLGHSPESLESMAQEYLEKVAISDELAGSAYTAHTLKGMESAGLKTQGLGQYTPANLGKTIVHSFKKGFNDPKTQRHFRRLEKVKDPGAYVKGVGKGLESRYPLTAKLTQRFGSSLQKLKK